MFGLGEGSAGKCQGGRQGQHETVHPCPNVVVFMSQSSLPETQSGLKAKICFLGQGLDRELNLLRKVSPFGPSLQGLAPDGGQRAQDPPLPAGGAVLDSGGGQLYIDGLHKAGLPD